MPSTQKKQIIASYNSYEEVASAFSAHSIGSYCIKIYRATINTPWDHYIMFNTDDGDAISQLEYSSNIKDFILVWSKESGEIAPLKHSNPKTFIINQDKVRKQNEALENNEEINALKQTINEKDEELVRLETTVTSYEKDLTTSMNKKPIFFKQMHENKITKLKNNLENHKNKCTELKNEVYKLKRQLGNEKTKIIASIS